ncbi:MAG TPA: hypothetical protein VIH40_13510 [Xanthobacteraceae bacterium]
MTKEQIKHMVDRFLGWKLPENFNPDAGISFKAAFNAHTAHPMKHEPSGTNLFDATQADAMVRYMVEGIPSNHDFRWLIEAPGPKYLAVRRLTSLADFEWTADHNKALAFRSEAQADDMMAALRQMDRLHDTYENNGKLSWGTLFAFEPTLGNAKAVEHGWM